MARESYRSLYGDLTKLKDVSLLDDPAGGPDADDALFQLLLAVSEAVDGYCGRHFYPLVTTRVFDGADGRTLVLPDLVSVTALRSDEDGDGVFETEWSADDYRLLPLNASPEQHWGRPYTAVRATGRHGRELRLGPARYEIEGTWGYRRYVEPSGETVDGGVSDLATTLPVTGGASFAVGQTLVISGEQLLVTGIEGDTLTVTRGLNGTTPEVQPDEEPIGILRWPAPVERATLINAARIWTRAPAFEPFYVDADLDTDVRLLLAPYRALVG